MKHLNRHELKLRMTLKRRNAAEIAADGEVGRMARLRRMHLTRKDNING